VELCILCGLQKLLVINICKLLQKSHEYWSEEPGIMLLSFIVSVLPFSP